MITGKQRAFLKSLANKLPATVYIGKADITDTTIAEMDNYLSAHELLKVKIQEGSGLTPKAAANDCAKILKAEFVEAIGRTFVLYREAEDKENRKIELPK